MKNLINRLKDFLTKETFDETNELLLEVNGNHLNAISNEFSKKRFLNGATVNKKVWLRKLRIGRRKFRRKFSILDKLNIRFNTTKRYDNFEEVNVINFLEEHYSKSNNGYEKVRFFIGEKKYYLTFRVKGRVSSSL